MVFIFNPLACTNIKACHALQRHVLASELDMDIFTEVLEPLVVVPIPKATCSVVIFYFFSSYSSILIP
jgi:hypothetical protein